MGRHAIEQEFPEPIRVSSFTTNEYWVFEPARVSKADRALVYVSTVLAFLTIGFAVFALVVVR